MYNVPGKAVFVQSARDNAEARVLTYFASPPLESDRRDVNQQKQLVSGAFAGVEWEVPRLLDSMWRAPDFYFDSVSQVRMDSWSSGRVVLLGDAACSPSPLSGMGTALALVGAYVLAGELAATPADYRAAFARYEHELRDYVARNQAFGLSGGNWLMPRSNWQIWMRNQNLRRLPYMPWKGLVTRTIQKTQSQYALKDDSSYAQRRPAFGSISV